MFNCLVTSFSSCPRIVGGYDRLSVSVSSYSMIIIIITSTTTWNSSDRNEIRS